MIRLHECDANSLKPTRETESRGEETVRHRGSSDSKVTTHERERKHRELKKCSKLNAMHAEVTEQVREQTGRQWMSQSLG